MKMKSRGILCSATLLAAFACAAQQGTVVTPDASQSGAGKKAAANYAKLPGTFEGNVGQTDPQVKFLSRGSGYVVFLTAGGMVFSARSQFVAKDGPQTSSPQTLDQKQSGAVIQLNLVGANTNPAAIGEDQQRGKANYFIGRDRSKWHTNVATYSKVHYKDVYPGIDLVYYGNPSQLEYDFEIAPGGNPRQIQFEVKGADSISIASNGDLVLQTKDGGLHIKSPVLYQTFNNMKLPVSGGFSLKSATRVGFSLKGYDKTKTLVIDPVLLYSSYLGGLANDQTSGIAVDSQGSAYVAGWTQSTNFPLASQGPTPGGINAFIAKLDVSGSSLEYSDFIGGNSQDYAQAMTIDSSNNAYITGYTCSNDFPIVNGFQTSMTSCYDGFIAKVSPDGSSLLYSSYLGGTGSTYSYAIAVDTSQEMYVAGATYSTDFPVQNAFQPSVAPNQNEYYGLYGFVTHLTADGSTLVYSTYLAGNTNVVQQCYNGPCWPSPTSAISGIALDGSSNVYVTGNTNTYNFPTSEGAYMPSQNSPSNQEIGFVSELSNSGSLVYSTYFGSTSGNYSRINAIAVDTNGSAYVTGFAYSDGAFPVTTPNLCDPGTYGGGCSYGFITKFNPTGTGLAYSTFLPPQNYASPQSLALDPQNNAYVLSSVYGGYMSTVNPIEAFTNQSDVLLTEIDPTGSIQLFSTYLGGNGDESPGGIAVDATGSIYVTGYTNSTDFPVTAAALQNTLGGNTDAFVAKIGVANAPAVAISPSLVQFSIRAVGSVSQPNTSLLRNMGSSALNISSIVISGDFTETDNCGTNVPAPGSCASTNGCGGSGVPPAGTCTFAVTFKPTAPGPRFGSILIQDDAAGSPHFINLVGDGSTSIVALSSTSLNFSSLQIGQNSPQQNVTLTNNGNATLNLTDIVITGDYAETNDCPSALGVGSLCTFQITFTPTVGGARNGALTLTDNAPDSPQSIALTGSGYVTTATISPASLTFGAQLVGTTSSPQPVTITNTGLNNMTVSAAPTSGDFAQTNQCSSIPATQSCTIYVTFTPTTVGSRSGTLTINDDAQGNPHSLNLDGTGIAPAVGFSPTSLTFSLQSVSSTSATQQVILTNTGNATLVVNNVQATGEFAQTSNCGTLQSNDTCVVSVTFTPTSIGNRTGTITFTDSAPNSPQTILLAGIAGAPANSLSVGSLTFPAQQVGSSSSSQPVVLTNTGNTNMVIANINSAGDFSQTNNCPPNLTFAASCTIQVTFTPVAGGSRTGALIVSNNAPGGSALVTLSGGGSDFGLATIGSGATTVKAGSKAAYQLTFASAGGPFANQVSLACSGAPALSTCSISPAMIPADSNSVAVSVTISTTAVVASLSEPHLGREHPLLAAWLFQVSGFLLFGLVSVGSKRLKISWRGTLLALVISLALFATACGGGIGTPKPVQQAGTPPGTYTLLVTASSGSLHHALPLTLKVQ
jgi:hypothetical protein